VSAFDSSPGVNGKADVRLLYVASAGSAQCKDSRSVETVSGKLKASLTMRMELVRA
jgi:hypothetical protein